ncbi:c-type cytochrome [Phenylobacterium aquaticum]|uniref:c-type cytochrome n=1 Tax=Phenylobacterium aquaticum TaxID=1763816 RepID=UPI001F5D57CA|nr:cytochrome c [Phenylobacterium aquaticum]MCI3133575.1 cytochrome c [Phenylobacterium aquaticum]
MTHRMMFRMILGAASFALAAPALADEPGPGGSKPPVPVTGEQVYQMVCQACHMADGKGGVGAGKVPALASNPKLKVAAYPIIMVSKGRGAMPWFYDTLSPAQTAAVITYVRTHFGNAYPEPVTAADVSKLAGPPPAAGH